MKNGWNLEESGTGPQAAGSTVGRYRVWSTVCSVLLLWATTACSGQEQLTEALKERAQSFWDARIAGDLIALYQMEAYSVRGPVSLQEYVRRGGNIVYNSVTLKDVKLLEDNEAVVRVEVDYRIAAMPSKLISSEVENHWVLINGEWYHQQR